jgi:hypothetical protein
MVRYITGFGAGRGLSRSPDCRHITVNARPLTLPGKWTQVLPRAVDLFRWMEHDASEGQIEQYSAAIRQ